MSSALYPIMEMFYTIQGEGYYTGCPAFFIRFAGCDVGCVWCDVKESWDANKHNSFTEIEILNEIKKTNAKHVVITGGEPAMYDLTELCESLASNGFILHIETSGAYDIKGNIDWICVSPKKFKAPLKETLLKADELKVVVFHPSDIPWAETFIREINPNCKLYLQPEWSKAAIITPLLVNYVKQNPQWNLSLQTHKYIDIP